MNVTRMAMGVLTLLLAARWPLLAGDPKEFTAVVADMVKALESANPGAQPRRLAVVTFINTKQSSQPNDFGEYLTESFVSEVNTIRSKYKLFERKRLDAVLKENDFMLSDLVNQDQAQKLGELLPIDVIFSGTYTKLKTYLDINARLIDVVTGEIVVSFSGRIQLTADLMSLFAEEGAGSGAGGGEKKLSALEVCRQNAKSIKVLLNDLSTEDKVRDVTSAAMRIPFDVECGTIHYEVMFAFKKYKIESEAYRRFLLGTLDTIPYPSLDERSMEIFKYLARDHVVDREEWAAGFGTIKRAGGSFSSYLKVFLKLTPLPDDLTEFKERIDAYFDAVKANKVGLPTPIPFNKAFFEMTHALKIEEDVRLRYYVYERYGRLLEQDAKTSASTYTLLSAMYKHETDRERKSTILTWLADFFNDVDDNEKAHDQLYDFVRSFERSTGDKPREEDLREYPPQDVETLVGLCRPKLAAYALLARSNSQKQDRIEFCVRYDIPLPGVIPTMEEAATILDGSDLAEIKRVTHLLELMGPRPKVMEEALVRLLDRKSVDDKRELNEIQTSAVVVLGQIRSSNARAIEQMITMLSSFEYSTADKAEDALVRIGKAAVPALLKKLGSLTAHEDGVRHRLIKVLGRMGKEAAGAKPTLQALLQKATNKDVRYMIEAALQAME